MAFPSLVLGSFNLTDWAGTAYQTQVIAEGTSRGAPVPIELAVKTWLQDGSIVLTQGYDNRTVTLRVKLRGASLTAVANAEAALFGELGKPNTLTWTPASGTATVFDVVTSSMEEAPSDQGDLAEALASPWRTFNLRLLCLASTRSPSQTVAAALAANGTTTTLVNDGSATTNWTGSVSAGTLTGPTVVSGAVKVGTTAALFGAVTVSATLTTSITTSSTKYLVVDWKPEPTSVTAADTPGIASLRAFGDGTELARIAETISPTAGYLRTTFYVAASSIAVLRLDSYTNIADSAGVTYDGSSSSIRSLYVDNINRTDIKPSLGSARQLLRSVDVAGSARAQASLAVEHSTNALGDVLVYVYPNSVIGYQPALRPSRVAGGATTTTDTSLVSGARDAIQGATATFDVPVSQIVGGLHLLAARGATAAVSATAATISWTVSTRIGSTTVGNTVSGSQSTTLPSTGYVILALGRVDLPTVDVSPGSATTVVRVTITATSTSGVNLDEAWLFNRDIGQLVGPVACGTGTAAAGGPARRLWVEPPSLTTPRPRVLVGHSADRSDAFYPGGAALGGWDILAFTPTKMNVLTVTTNALDASVTLRHYPRWHTNAAS